MDCLAFDSRLDPNLKINVTTQKKVPILLSVIHKGNLAGKGILALASIFHTLDPDPIVNSLVQHFALNQQDCTNLEFWTWTLLCTCFNLRVVYIMDHEVVLKPYKTCDWLLNSSQDHCGLYQGKNVRVTMESQKEIFDGLHYQVAWFNGFCGGRGKIGVLVEKSKGLCQRNVVIMNQLVNFFLGKRR